VLVERFASLVASGIDAARILAITFTEKAATQIKDRVVKRFEREPELRRAVERAPVSTIHGLCNSILSEHAIRVGIDPQFKVMDELAAKVEQSAAMESVLDKVAAERRETFLEFAGKWKSEDVARDLLGAFPRIRGAGGVARALAQTPRYDPRRAARELVGELEALLSAQIKHTEGTRRREAAAREWISRMEASDLLEWSARLPFDGRTGSKGDPIKDSIDSLKEKLEGVRREAIAAAQEHLIPFVRDIYSLFEQEYARRKRIGAMLDFDDLEERTAELLESEAETRRAIQERFDAILMDELQDTNPIQWRIVNLIRRPNRFFAVGDLNQSIFGFRSAEPALFREYGRSVRESGGEIDRLEENYRSRQAILDAATGVLVPVNRGVDKHRLVSGKSFPPREEPAVEILKASADSDDLMWLARRLRDLHGTLEVGEEGKRRKARFSDMAILARTTTPFAGIQAALTRFGIPFVVERGSNFFEEPVVLDLVNLLRVLHQPDDDIALFGVLRSPLFGVADEEIAKLRLEGRIAPAAAQDRLDRLRRDTAGIPPQPALARLLDETGYLERLQRQGRADLVKFFSLLDQLEEESPGNLGAWIDRIDELRSDAKETSAPILEAGDAVTVLSIHKSKGLEFPIVAVANLHAPAKSDTDPIAFHPAVGLGLRWRVPGDESEGVGDPILFATRELDSRRQEGEDDRLLYVAMTRAEERLVLCWREGGRGRRSEWPRMVEAGLRQAIEAGEVAVAEVSGEPEIPPPPRTAAMDAPPAVAAREEQSGEGGAVAVTALAVFAACPWRYYLQSAAGWPQQEAAPELAEGSLEGSTEPGGKSFGTEVHNALAGLPAGEEAVEFAAQFTSSELGLRAAAATSAFREFDFIVELEGHLLRGQIDLWFEEAGKLILVDYKTDRRLSADRLAEYSRQLRFYALAIRKLKGTIPHQALLFDLRGAKPIKVSLEESELEECLEAWRRFQRMRQERDFPPQPGQQCAACPYSLRACPAAPQS
jgi:ATP-dependent exoDNAse (exonuclease V) beta subunit